jgi:hypothetical protein
VNDLLSRREFHRLMLAAGAAATLPPSLAAQSTEKPSGFAHPGMLQNRRDLERMRQAVRAKSQPVYDGFLKLSAHPDSKLSYVPAGASVEIGRNPNIRFTEFDRDCNAAYQCALMAAIAGDPAYARLAIAIVDDWAKTLKKISGLDAVLCATLGGFKMVNAAELLRHTETGWSTAAAERFGTLVREVFLPVVYEFAPFANGNWDTAAIKLMLAIAIYGDDRPLFDRAVNYYRHGSGDGQLAHYIYANGQCQESGRDQQHTQLGLAHMGDACEMAWHQGLDLYGELDNRLLAGFEYTASYILGEDVPFLPDVDRTGKYRHAVISARSDLRPGYEQIFNHYVRRRGLPAPWTAKAAEKLRPEGAGFQADATGFGTLLYTREPGPDSADAAAIQPTTVVHTEAVDGGVSVDFVPLVGASRYRISRATNATGPFQMLAKDVAEAVYRDRSAKAGVVYFYRVATTASTESLAVSQMVGLPPGWEQRRVGGLTGAATASFDGSTFRLVSGGAKSVQGGGPYLWVQRNLPKAGGFQARLLPQIASSFASVGLAVHGDAGEVLLLVTPKAEPLEYPSWSALLVQRADALAAWKTLGQMPLVAPTIVDGRLRGAIWMRMASEHGMLRAAVSQDGAAWTEIAACATPSGDLRAGLFLSSGIADMTTEAMWDRVTVQP